LSPSDTSLDGTPKSSVRGGDGILVDPSSTHFSSRGAANTTLALHKMDKFVGEKAQGPTGVVESKVDASQNAKDKAESKTHDVSRQSAHTGHSSASAAGTERGRAREREVSSAATGVGDDGDGSSNQGSSSGGVEASAEQDSSSALVEKEASASPRQSHSKMRLRSGDNSSDEEEDKVFESSFRKQAEKTGLPIHAVAGRGPILANPAGVEAAAANGKPVTIFKRPLYRGFI
jgi:hypothetical protein